MAKKKSAKNQLQIDDIKHYQDTEAYVKKVQELYNKAISDISSIVSKNKDILGTDNFTFDKSPALEAQVTAIIKDLSDKIAVVIDRGDRKAWIGACEKSDKFIDAILNTSKLPKDRLQKYQDRNLEALAAFQERKVNGLNLSERVWHYVANLKEEAELAIDTSRIINSQENLQRIVRIEHGIGSGISAAELSRDIRSCLKEPNKLFRRVRDKHGNLRLSKAAKLYHPGQGVYRSSYKNAMRLTRTEINMAYRQSDHLRWNQLDFVIGMKIELSNNHTIIGPDGKTRIPLVDVCDYLVGNYPKDFKFVGWHPQCKCHATPILKSLDELDQEIDANGNYKQLAYKDEVTDTPHNFKEYIVMNQQRIKGWSSKPYYITDNPQYVDKAINPSKYIKKSLVLSDEQAKLMSDLEMYGYNHSGSKKFNAALEDAKKAILAGDKKAYDDAVATMQFTKATNERIQAYNAKKKVAGQENTEEVKKKRTKKEIIESAKKRHQSRTQDQEDEIFINWSKRQDNASKSIIRLNEEETRKIAEEFLGKAYTFKDAMTAKADIAEYMIHSKESFERYVDGYAKKDKGIKRLLDTFKSSKSGIVKQRIIERIRERCAGMSVKELQKMGAVEGLTYKEFQKNYKIGRTATFNVGGTNVDIVAKHYDLVTFVDTEGTTYSYPIGTTRKNVNNTVNAGQGSKYYALKPDYIRKNNKGFVFVDDEHPNDAYFRIVYKHTNFKRGAMYGSDPISVHCSYTPQRFADTACHEVGHHIYDKNKLENKYAKAVSKDPKGKYPTEYSKAAITEDFADSIEFINTSATAREYFEKEFPNRYKFIVDNVPGFTPMKHLYGVNGSRRKSVFQENRESIEDLFEKEINKSTQTYTKEQVRNNADISIRLSIKRTKDRMDHRSADSGSVNQGTGPGYDDNCALTTITYELRRRGFDVTAKALRQGDTESWAWIAGEDYCKVWNGVNSIRAEAKGKKTIQESIEEITKKPGRYHISYDINENSGHIITAERLNDGTLVLYDSQVNEYRNMSVFENKKSIDVFKVDDATINVDAVNSLVETIKFKKKKR